MRSYHMAMLHFWSQFSLDGVPVPAFLSGRVPDGTPFPYITFDCPLGSFGGKNILTAICWHHEKSGLNVMAQRAELLEQIAAAIPESGTSLQWDGGGAVLYRNATNFQSYYDVEAEKPDGKPVLGGMTSYEINFYNL